MIILIKDTMTNINYPIAGGIILIAIILLILFIRRDRKDEKDFMDEINGTIPDADNGEKL